MTAQLALFDGPDVGCVYYGTDFVNVKIGTTTSLRRRGGELRIHMIHTVPGGEFEERRQQRMWRRYQIGTSEWFCPGDDLLLWLFQETFREIRRQSQPDWRPVHALMELLTNTKRKEAA